MSRKKISEIKPPFENQKLRDDLFEVVQNKNFCVPQGKYFAFDPAEIGMDEVLENFSSYGKIPHLQEIPFRIKGEPLWPSFLVRSIEEHCLGFFLGGTAVDLPSSSGHYLIIPIKVGEFSVGDPVKFLTEEISSPVSEYSIFEIGEPIFDKKIGITLSHPTTDPNSWIVLMADEEGILSLRVRLDARGFSEEDQRDLEEAVAKELSALASLRSKK